MLNNQYELNQSLLYQCHSKKKLARILQIDIKEMLSISENPQYFSFKKKKKNSMDERDIEAPEASLKKIQRRIFTLLKRIRKPAYLMAGEKGKSTYSNAEFHQYNSFFLKLDMANFYPNCKREYVYNFFFLKMHCSKDVSKILCDLTCHNGALIQGSSASMVLTYFAYEDMFSEIDSFLKSQDLIWTTWVDDITISKSEPFNKDNIILKISRILVAYGHHLKPKKTRYIKSNSPKLVTGVIINKKNDLKVRNQTRNEIIRMFQRFNNRDDFVDTDEFEHLRKQLLGKISFAQQTEPHLFSELRKKVKAKSY